MTPDPALLKSIEQLGYRVTVGDVAAKAGLDVNTARKGLLALAEQANGHLQVASTGEIVYLFPENFRSVLSNKYWQLQYRKWLDKIWQVIFYIIRISFGIVLILSILIMLIAVVLIVVLSLLKAFDSDNDSGSSEPINIGGGGGFGFFPGDIFWILSPSPNYNYYEQREIAAKTDRPAPKLGFLASIFSFLFGDGNPNFNIEEKRWQIIGTVIKNNRGSVTAEQLAPYLDEISPSSAENEDYVIPVLSRFDGYPQVSDKGEIIYYFPELQVTAKQRKLNAVASHLKEKLWKFSEAETGQIITAIGLGAFNFILALVLGYFIKNGSLAVLGSFGVFVGYIYWFLLIYAIGFLTVPTVRYFVLQGRNKKVEARNRDREGRAALLNANDPKIQAKIDYSRQFADQKLITAEDITYSTDRDYLDQEIDRSAKIDEEWRKRLEG